MLVDDLQGLALLHWACDRGHEPMVRCLLDCGADVNIRVRHHLLAENIAVYHLSSISCFSTKHSLISDFGISELVLCCYCVWIHKNYLLPMLTDSLAMGRMFLSVCFSYLVEGLALYLVH